MTFGKITIFINAGRGQYRSTCLLPPSFIRWSTTDYSSWSAGSNANIVKSSYTLLNVTEECSKSDLRTAYLAEAKKYHPDSGSPHASGTKFTQVEQAYKTVVAHRKLNAKDVPTDEEIVYDIKHTAPQHRQFLSFEGIGEGSLSNRQKQYDQYRVRKAAENILEYRMKKENQSEEKAMVAKDKKASRSSKMSNAIERMVEDMIQESMGRGEFNNLSGMGKPLQYSNHNPMLDTETHNLNKVLINNGYMPDWINLEKEIKNMVYETRGRLAKERKMIGPPPYSGSKQEKWKFQVDKLTTCLVDINELIDKYNMIVPILNKQMAHFSSDLEVKRILNNYEQYIPSSDSVNYEPYTSQGYIGDYNQSATSQPHDPIQWKQVWKDIKMVFKP